jgi:hypothetical protein
VHSAESSDVIDVFVDAPSRQDRSHSVTPLRVQVGIELFALCARVFPD